METDGQGLDRETRDLAWRLSAIVDASSDAILGGTLDGVITFWNSSAAQILGYTAGEVVGRRVTDLVPADRQGELAEVMRRLRAGKPSGPYDTKRRRKDGSMVDLSVSVAPVIDSGGTVVGAATVARDITERVRAEEHSAALEGQLQQAELMGTVGELASGVAHDFKNLLGIVVAYAESAADIESDLHVRKLLAEIRLAADRAVQLSDDLMAFGRRNLTEPEPVDVNALISGACELLRVAAGSKTALSLDLAPIRLPAVLAEPHQLEQVLLNLALNARDAMPAGGTLTIATTLAELDERQARLPPGASPGPYLELTVTDTGTGMTDDIAGRIFDRFYTTKPLTGTGLGLASVKAVITAARGSIEVDTKPGSGTTFRIYLPAMPGPSASQPSRRAGQTARPRVKHM
jgi:PAS domain S-box-containing protein